MEQEMRELYNEDPANHVGPESCVGDPRGRSEALTGGVRAGLLSRETALIPGCRRRPHGGRQDCWRRYTRVAGGPCAVRDPRHVRQAPCTRTRDLVVARWLLVTLRHGWFAGWQI